MAVIAGAALQALEDYNLRTSRFVRMQGVELQKMIAMLAETIISIGATSQQSVQRLQQIERHVESAQASEDIRLVKVRLGECLQEIREEAQRRKSENAAIAESLRREADGSQQRMTSSAEQELDVATGLPRKPQAENAIREALSSPARYYVVVAVIGRFQLINARFGEALGDQVLKRFREHLESRLASGDRLFRWSGPALVALLERPDGVDKVRTEIRRFASATVNGCFEMDGRSVEAPISTAWSVFAAQPTAEALFKQIELFVANQASRE